MSPPNNGHADNLDLEAGQPAHDAEKSGVPIWIYFLIGAVIMALVLWLWCPWRIKAVGRTVAKAFAGPGGPSQAKTPSAEGFMTGTCAPIIMTSALPILCGGMVCYSGLSYAYAGAMYGGVWLLVTGFACFGKSILYCHTKQGGDALDAQFDYPAMESVPLGNAQAFRQTNRHGNPREPVVAFGGNGFTAKLTILKFGDFLNSAGAGDKMMYSVDNRGYTKNNPGNTNEKNLIEDAAKLILHAFRKANGDSDTGSNKVVVLGFSLGCAVAIGGIERAVEIRREKGLPTDIFSKIVLGNPFTSVPETLRRKIGNVSLSMLFPGAFYLGGFPQWRSISRVQRGGFPNVPVLMLSNKGDQVIHSALHRKLFLALKKPSVGENMFLEADGGHNDWHLHLESKNLPDIERFLSA